MIAIDRRHRLRHARVIGNACDGRIRRGLGDSDENQRKKEEQHDERGYQILILFSGARKSASPGLVANASWNASTCETTPFVRYSYGA